MARILIEARTGSPALMRIVCSVLLLAAPILSADIEVVSDHNDVDAATPGFRFKSVPPPAQNDAAATATFTLLQGQRDRNGGSLDTLHDGRVPLDEDQPSENFFFRAGTVGGRLLLDLGELLDLKQINTYSWHPSTRGPQVYTLYASDGKADGFNARPASDADPGQHGWKRIAQVDNRPDAGEGGGQYGVSISSSEGTIGPYRYLLWDISRTEERDPFGNTFYSEIDVIDAQGPAPEPVAESKLEIIRETVVFADGAYRATVDTSETPDLTDWTREKIVPMIREWYPKLVALLPSEGYQAPTNFSVTFDRDMRGVAATSGRRIRCGGSWMRRNLKGEAVGAVFHEMVHVVQQYGRTRRSSGASRPPGWLTEGLTDYLRFYVFEPESRGAEITRRNFDRARYDGSYRITANFLNWVGEQHGQDFVPKLNAAIREGRYRETTWKTLTGRTLEELGEAWKKDLAGQLEIRSAESTVEGAGSDSPDP